MVTVARGLDAPIKLLWPKSMYLDASNGYTMLGYVLNLVVYFSTDKRSLGDIVVPGMFIAFALRYDLHRSTHRDPAQPFVKPFFTTTLISYVLGLITTVVVMHTFQSAQPALLYLRFVYG
jgi:minor histocompatibility antigen H13